MTAKLLIDPSTNRLVYLSRNGIMPERVFILDGERQHLFTLGACKVVEYRGEISSEVSVDNCWQYRLAGARLERIAE